MDQKTTDSNATLIKGINTTNNDITEDNDTPIMVTSLEEEKYPLHQPYMTQFTENEYATKKCIRPVRNNVFMEKGVDECSSPEINFEVERLICCLHFLAEEYNIYHSLKGYLGAIENESKENDIMSPSVFSVKNRNRKSSNVKANKTMLNLDEDKTIVIKRSNTAHHIKWLHNAYVTERDQRASHKKLSVGNGKPPNFNNVIEKRTRLKQMYEYLTSIWRDLVKDMSIVWKREHPDTVVGGVMDINHVVKGSKAQQNLIEDLKNRLKVSSINKNEIIKKLSTFSSEEEWSYAGNEEKYDPLFESTPTVDEMVCYESLCNVIFNEHVSSSNFHGSISDFQKIKQAFSILRANDHAIASQTCGWVTTIDNLLSVLLYRDLSWYTSNFIGELRISLLIESTKDTKLKHYENKTLLTAIKKSINFAFCGVPSLQEAQDNVFNINHIILRHKKTENSNVCSCFTKCCGSQAHLARLTFGILCDDSKPNSINTMNNKFNKQFPYKFLYQSKRLFEQIYRNKFIRFFDSSCRKQQAQLKCTEMHTYDLSIFEYPKYEIDQLLTTQFAESLPSTYQNDNFTTSNELMTLRNYESQTIKKHIQQQEGVENYFIHSFDTSNLHEFAETMVEEDYGVMVETRIVNLLNKVSSLINPTVAYSKPKKDKDDIGAIGSMDRNISNTSDVEVNREKGHKICCGHCFLTFGMIAYALVMSIIVGIGGLNIWLIGQAPMEPTIENILGFTQKMIAAETEYVAERALFSTKQFIDFTNVLPDVNQEIFDTFLDNNYTSPRFDGIIQIGYNANVSANMSSFIFNDTSFECNIDSGNCNQNDLYQIAKNIWDNKLLGVVQSYTNSYFMANNIINSDTEGGSIWFITWRYINSSNVIIGAIVDSYRINEEYASLSLAKDGIVYWITDDEYKDVFATSLHDRLLYITEHNNDESSINLDTTFGYINNAQYDIKNVDNRITLTMNEMDDTDEYYIYSTDITATFGNFNVIIAFPRENVFEKLNFGRNLVILFTILAVIFGILNACIANAVPLVPYDDSWLATPLFTEEDKRKLNQAVEREKAAGKKERRHGVNPLQSPVSKQSLPAKLAKTISKKTIFKPMKTETMDIPLAPIVPSVSRNKSIENMFGHSIDNGHGDNEFNQYRSDRIDRDPNGDVNRQRSNSDQMINAMRKMKIESKMDAINKIQRLADTGIDNISVPLKKGASDDYKLDDDDDDGPPTNFGRAVSVATGMKANIDEPVRKKKETKQWFKDWKKKQQKKQLQKNIANADMRSIFSREESKYKTKYGQRVNTMLNVICSFVAFLIVFAYLSLRTYTEGDIETIMEAYLNISNIIMENHAEFKVYQHELAFLEGQILLNSYELSPYNKVYNDRLLSNFYNAFDEQLTGIFSFVGTEPATSTGSVNDIHNLSLYGNVDTKNECVEIYEITNSYLATCIVWKQCNGTVGGVKGDITDCVLHTAIYETYKLLGGNRSIAWSVPFPCFGNVKVCYVGIAKSMYNGEMYIGTLMSFDKLADTAKMIIWQESGMGELVNVSENKIDTSYNGDNVLFSFYLFTHSTGDDYLLSVTGNDITTTVQTTYGIELTSIMHCNASTNAQVQTTYNYFSKTEQIINNDNNLPVIIWSSWSYPKIVYSWYENDLDTSLNWRLVITISSAIFLGDHNVYNTVGSISIMGWVIIYLFIHFITYRRFEENITYWEELYWQQVMQSIRNLTDGENINIEDEWSQDEEFDSMDIPNTDPIMVNSHSKHFDENNNNNDESKEFDEDEQDEQLRSLEFISGNIRETVRESCEKSWIREQHIQDMQSELPTKRKDITDHYHKRALRHIYQAKKGMNIITVVQMEKYGKSKEYRLQLYSLQSSSLFRWFMEIMIVIHILLVFWRPLTSDDLHSRGYQLIPLCIELFCLFFEFLDLILTGFIQFKWQDTKMNPLMSPAQTKNIYVLRFIIWLLVAIDVILIIFLEKSFTRLIPLRPFLLILSNDKLIGACYALLITSINAADALLLFIMLLGMASISGVILFRFEGVLMDVYNVYSFQNLIRSMFTAYVFIISGENYGELVYISFEKSPFLIIYFIMCTVLGTWIVVSLVVSRFQTSFKQIYNKERQRRLYFKRTGYVAAFSLINLDNDNEVSKLEFESFVRYIRHETDIHDTIKRQLQFEDFDTDGDDSIDIREFVTTLESIYQKPSLIDIIKDDDSLLSWIQLHIVETEAFAQFVLVIILIEVILFALFGIYPGQLSTEMLDLLLGITVLLNGIDIAVKIFSMGWQYYWNTSKCRIINRHKLRNTNTHTLTNKIKKHEKKATLDTLDMADIADIVNVDPEEDNCDIDNQEDNQEQEFEYEESVYTQDPLHLKQREFAHRFDLVIVASAVSVFAISRIIVQRLWFEDNLNTVRIVMVIPLLRLFTLIKTTRSAVYIITKVIPRFISLVIILLLLFYIYAVFGVYLIGDGNWLKYLAADDNQPLYSFDTFADSLVTLFQLTVGEGWHDIMYATVYARNSLLLTTWYFVTFVLIITLIFTNLFVGLVISVVDDVEIENKTKYSNLRKDYKKQQKEEEILLLKNMKHNNNHKQHKSNLYL